MGVWHIEKDDIMVVYPICTYKGCNVHKGVEIKLHYIVTFQMLHDIVTFQIVHDVTFDENWENLPTLVIS